MSLRKVLARPSLAVGTLIILGMFVVAMAAPIIAPPQGDDPYVLPRDGFSPMPQPPGPTHRLGTMEGQGDVFYGLIWGTRMAFRLGIVITLGRVIVGVLLGLFSGAYGGFVDAVLMRITDAFLAFPIMAAVMVAVALFGAQLSYDYAGRPWLAPSNEERVIIITMILFGWMAYARLLRGNVLSEREKEYMEAANSTGTTRRRILFRHLLPNVTAGIFVLGASDIGAVVVWLAAFNFIGFVRYSESSMMADWGRMLALSRNWIIGSPSRPFEFWYTFVPASAAIVLFSIGWNLIGDGLRDLLDPRTRRGHISHRATR
jgi:peptide/nickel transport system permease protein